MTITKQTTNKTDCPTKQCRTW